MVCGLRRRDFIGTPIPTAPFSRSVGSVSPHIAMLHDVLTKYIRISYHLAMDVQYQLNGDLFVWDSDKAELNWRKHGVRFEEAAAVFSDPMFVLTDASRNDEARDAAIGFDSNARLLFVVHIEIEDSCIRLISARRAERHEEDEYAY